VNIVAKIDITKISAAIYDNDDNNNDDGEEGNS